MVDLIQDLYRHDGLQWYMCTHEIDGVPIRREISPESPIIGYVWKGCYVPCHGRLLEMPNGSQYIRVCNDQGNSTACGFISATVMTNSGTRVTLFSACEPPEPDQDVWNTRAAKAVSAGDPSRVQIGQPRDWVDQKMSISQPEAGSGVVSAAQAAASALAGGEAALNKTLEKTGLPKRLQDAREDEKDKDLASEFSVGKSLKVESTVDTVSGELTKLEDLDVE